MVRLNGLLIKNVRKQTHELCLEAVTSDSYALEFVEKQTEDICIAAVTQNGWALKFVKNLTPDIISAATLQNPATCVLVKDIKPTPKNCISYNRRSDRRLNCINYLNGDRRFSYDRRLVY